MPASCLPELFAGTERVAGRPVDLFRPACVPQVWAAAVPLALFAAMLSLRVDERRRVVRLAPAPAATGPADAAPPVA